MKHARGLVWVVVVGGLVLAACPGDTEIAREPLSGGEGNTAGSGGSAAADDDEGADSDGLAGRPSANAGTSSQGGSSGGDDDDEDPAPVAGSGGSDGSAGTDSGEGGSSAAGTGGRAGSGGMLLPKCTPGGCSGQVCQDASEEPIITTCEFLEEYACYREAICEAQADGNCGWTQTPELQACLSNGGPIGKLQWYMACGDPACISADPTDDSAIPNCTDQEVGDSCDLEGEQCDNIAGCGAKMICAAEDPANIASACDP